jgi:hypothetical protein
MNNQNLINALGILSSTLDALNRAGEKEAMKEITAKIIELTKKL